MYMYMQYTFDLRQGKPASLYETTNPDYEDLFKRPQCILKAKSLLLWLHVHVRHNCAYELDDNFNEVFKHVELESISKNSSDAVVWVATPPTAHEDVLQWLPRRGETGNEVRLAHATSTASAIKHDNILFCSYPVLRSCPLLYHTFVYIASIPTSLFHLALK